MQYKFDLGKQGGNVSPAPTMEARGIDRVKTKRAGSKGEAGRDWK